MQHPLPKLFKLPDGTYKEDFEGGCIRDDQQAEVVHVWQETGLPFLGVCREGSEAFRPEVLRVPNLFLFPLDKGKVVYSEMG